MLERWYVLAGRGRLLLRRCLFLLLLGPWSLCRSGGRGGCGRRLPGDGLCDTALVLKDDSDYGFVGHRLLR